MTKKKTLALALQGGDTDAAQTLGAMGGVKGGPARQKLWPSQRLRSKTLRAAARKRWDTYYARHPKAKKRADERPCKRPECEGVAVAKSLCRRHYISASEGT